MTEPYDDRIFYSAGWVMKAEDGTYGAGALRLPASAQQSAAVDAVKAERAQIEAQLEEESRVDQLRFAAKQAHGVGADLSLGATLERARTAMEQSERIQDRQENRGQVLAQQRDAQIAEAQAYEADLIPRLKKRRMREQIKAAAAKVDKMLGKS